MTRIEEADVELRFTFFVIVSRPCQCQFQCGSSSAKCAQPFKLRYN